jgi:NADH dehydrogenase/NADH:ubiquinone oxidoreductase subunit G
MANELHDRWLEKKPEGAKHDSDTCSVCLAGSSPHGGDMSEGKTFSEAEVADLVASKVAEATAPLNEKIAEFQGSQQAAEVDANIAQLTAEHEAAIADLRKELDEAVLDAKAAKDEHAALTSYLEGLKTEADREAEIERLSAERTAKVAEVASFPEDYVKTNTARWAGMEEEAFTAYLDDLKAAGAKPASTSGIPNQTALTASREEHGPTDAVKEVIRLRADGIDPRHI